jgi:hypothetical protein
MVAAAERDGKFALHSRPSAGGSARLSRPRFFGASPGGGAYRTKDCSGPSAERQRRRAVGARVGLTA